MKEIYLPEKQLIEYFKDSIEYYKNPPKVDIDIKYMVLDQVFGQLEKPEDILEFDVKTLRRILRVITEANDKAKKTIDESTDQGTTKTSIITENTKKIINSSLKIK